VLYNSKKNLYNNKLNVYSLYKSKSLQVINAR